MTTQKPPAGSASTGKTKQGERISMNLDKLESETGPMSYEEAAARLAEIEGMDINEFLTDGKPDVAKIVSKRRTADVKSIKVDNVGRVISIELYNENKYGNIYLITSDSGHTKIGYAKNIKTRFSAINQGVPNRLFLHYSRMVNNVRELEAVLHKRFHDLRVKGEWFSLSESDLVEAVKIIESYE